MERVGIGKDGLALLLLLVRKSIAAHQLIDDGVGLGQLPALYQFYALLYQHLFVYLFWEHLFQIAEDGQQEGTSLPEVGFSWCWGRRRHWCAGGHDHSMQIGRAVGEGTLSIVATVSLHEVLTYGILYLAELCLVDRNRFELWWRREGQRVNLLPQLFLTVGEVAVLEEGAVPLGAEVAAERCLIVIGILCH